MTGYLMRRVVQAIIVVLGVTLVVFLLSHLIPGGQARAALGPRANHAQIIAFNHANGYDQPLLVQYWRYITGLVAGNLGYSYKNNQGVAALIMNRIPKTLALVGVSTLLALLIALPLGMAQAVRRNSGFDYSMTAVTFVLYATPAFLIGELSIIFFSFTLGWLPSSVPSDASSLAIFTNPLAFVLPVVTLAALTIAAFSRYMRSSVLDALTGDYIRTARAKGASPRRVLYGHAMRNALLPILTLIGLSLPAIVGGALITEVVFNYPGMGLLTVQAAQNIDIPLVLGTTLVATVATVGGSLLADVLYAAADPRIRLGNS
ncbi:MAG: ABC transporter permease [Actinomycetes bacterium]